MELTRRDEKALTALCLGSYFFLGTLAILFPSILPSVVQGFGLKYGEAGLVFPASSVGSLIGGILTGLWSDRVGRKPFLFASAFLSGLALIGAFRAGQWALFVASFLLLGLAQGALSNSINALVLDISAGRRGKALNTLHALYSLGATVSPFFIKWLLGPGTEWRRVLFAAAWVWLALSLAALAFRYPSPSAQAASSQKKTFRFGLLAHGLFALLFAVAFLYNGVAWALLGWVKEFVQRAGARPELTAAMLSIFYLGLTAGRFSCAHISGRLGYGRTLFWCGVGTALAYPLAVFASVPAVIAAGVLLSGLFLAGLYPTALAYCTRLFPGIPGTVTGTMSIAMTMGGALPPWWTGKIGDGWGLASALRLNYLMVLPLVGIGWYLWQQERRGVEI
ncbi:MAG: MFS transporter [Armatimonadetes bacterium]|nr:MFS transporter [Armatimonadota bacterium]